MALLSHFIKQDSWASAHWLIIKEPTDAPLSLSSLAQTNSSRKAKKTLFLGAVLGGALFVSLYPLLATASIFSAFLQKTASQSSASAAKFNSQNAPVLAPATNIDPRPTGGGDIVIQDDVALVPSGNLAGTSVEKRADSSQISVYIVQEGDTLSVIAGMFDVSVNTILWANDIKGGVVRPGQELIILPITGIQHKVSSGDTLATLAKKYQSDARDIAQYNNLPDDATLVIGETVIIPDGVVPTPASTKTVSGKTPVTQKTAASGYYAWPVAGGRLTQGIHGLNGVDIGGIKEGTSILAAADGIVIVAKDNGGWNGGYGNYIVIKHTNGTQTLYAHAQTGSLRVSVGSTVTKGQAIAGVGQTGKATGLHLHFEVRGSKNPFGK